MYNKGQTKLNDNYQPNLYGTFPQETV